MKIKLKQKDNLTLLPTYLEVELDEIPSGLDELEKYYLELCKYDEILFYPTVHNSYIYNNFLPYLISRLMVENIPVNIIATSTVISYVSRLSVKSIIVIDSSQNIIKATRFYKNLTKNDFILISELPAKSHVNLIKKQMMDNKIPITLAIHDGLVEIEELRRFHLYTSKIGVKDAIQKV